MVVLKKKLRNFLKKTIKKTPPAGATGPPARLSYILCCTRIVAELNSLQIPKHLLTLQYILDCHANYTWLVR